MRLIRSVRPMQRQALDWKRAGVRIGFVPTMGWLHEGHLTLIRSARKHVGAAGRVVASVYVNPKQFGPREDLSRYPRDLDRDAALCRSAGVDLLFAPGTEEIYPSAPRDSHSTHVSEGKLSLPMEGKSRPGHFDGVTTIVAKLFNIVLPDIAVFGAKDFQQAAVVRRMTRDLNFPVRIVVEPTAREKDGLALSSRNQYLSASERREARVLSAALRQARKRVRSAKTPFAAARIAQEVACQIRDAAPQAKIDYIELFEPDTLDPVKKAKPGVQMALAVFIGKTRLLDNIRL